MDDEGATEVHFYEKSGRLELDCGASDFSRYLETAVRQFGGKLGIPLDRVTEINVVNTHAATRDRSTWRRNVFYVVVSLVIAIVVFLAILGLSSLIANI